MGAGVEEEVGALGRRARQRAPKLPKGGTGIDVMERRVRREMEGASGVPVR